MKIESNQVVLREVERADMEYKVRWYSDPRINRTLLLEEKFDLDKTLKWFDEHIGDNSRREFIIENRQGERIGITGLVHIDLEHRMAECYCVIGNEAYWGKGIGTEVHRLLIDWGFKNLGLQKIWADIRAENAAIIKVVGRLGFTVEGTPKQDRYIDGKKVDVVRIELLRHDFYAVHPELERKGA